MTQNLIIDFNTKTLDKFIRLVFPYVIELSYEEWFKLSNMKLEDRQKYILEKARKLHIKTKVVIPLLQV